MNDFITQVNIALVTSACHSPKMPLLMSISPLLSGRPHFLITSDPQGLVISSPPLNSSRRPSHPEPHTASELVISDQGPPMKICPRFGARAIFSKHNLDHITITAASIIHVS